MKTAECAVVEKKIHPLFRKMFGATFLFFLAKGMVWLLIFSGLINGIL